MPSLAPVEPRTALRISVVIPVRDDGPMLTRCLEALARQTRQPDEIVVVDNASSDDSAAIARAGGARVVTQPIPGIPRASSTGYDAATGDVIARLDADSVPATDWIARIEELFAADPHLDFVTGDARFYGSNAVIRWIARHVYIGLMYAVLNPFLGHSTLFGSNMAMRASAWARLADRVHRDGTNIHDDLDLALQIEPDMGVRRDSGLIVAVSARPFDSPSSLWRRISWVIPTMRLGRQQQTYRERRQAHQAAQRRH